jgi:hypothetical protein
MRPSDPCVIAGWHRRYVLLPRRKNSRMHSSISFRSFSESQVRNLLPRPLRTPRQVLQPGNPTVASELRPATRALIEILHHKPSAYGINRSNWTQASLADAFGKLYCQRPSKSTVSRLLKQAGLRWKKSRKVLTSPDPNYREKVELLLRTFHSLDELAKAWCKTAILQFGGLKAGNFVESGRSCSMSWFLSLSCRLDQQLAKAP